jgi:hypothetical protein
MAHVAIIQSKVLMPRPAHPSGLWKKGAQMIKKTIFHIFGK